MLICADKRITNPDSILDVITDASGFVEAKKVSCPEIKEAHICFEVPLKLGEKVRLIDYASAGKTWDEKSRLAAWIRIK